MRRDGWALLLWDASASTWDALVADVGQRREQDPERYKAHPSTKFLKRLSDVVLYEVCTRPGHENYLPFACHLDSSVTSATTG